MSTDRPGSPDSGSATIASGDSATTVTTVVDTRDDTNFEVEKIILSYPVGGTAAQVQFFDDPDGTADGDLSSALLTLEVDTASGDGNIVIEDPSLRDIENDILVEPDGNQTEAIEVFVGGKNLAGAR